MFPASCEASCSRNRRLPTPWSGCASAERLFLRPVRALHAGVRYTVSFTGTTLAKHTNSSFTVGDQAFPPEGPIRADVHYLSNYTDASCTGPHCSWLATVSVDIGSAPALPRLLVVESAASADGKNESMFWPMTVEVDPSSRHKAQLGVALPPDDDCVTIRIYGLGGHPLFEEQRCAPAVRRRKSRSTRRVSPPTAARIRAA